MRLALLVTVAVLSGCWRMTAEEKEPADVVAILGAYQSNPVGFKSKHDGDNVLISGSVIRTGFLEMQGGLLLTTSYFGSSFVRRSETRVVEEVERIPYVAVGVGDPAALVFCVLNRGWDGDLAEASAGRMVRALGEFDTVDRPETGGDPYLVLRRCRVARIYDVGTRTEFRP